MTEPVLFFGDEPRGRAFAQRWRNHVPLFVCALAHTDTCLIPGVSAAGATIETRSSTPAADGEAVTHGVARCLPSLPSNPLGPPGPAGLTRAAISLAKMQVELIGAGLRIWPDAPIRRVDCEPGARIDLGCAVPDAARLCKEGLSLGRELSACNPRIVLGESVPGGTTTALSLLLALGVDARGMVSGSVPGNAHALKVRLATLALDAAGLKPGDGLADPLGAAAAVGDPMQPLAAGIAIGAARAGAEVLLAGGSQMLAVAALIRAMAGREALFAMAVGTTRWVAMDPAANVPRLAALVDPQLPLLAANLNLSASRHHGLRRYEDFFVKEGVGAGGACIAALLATGAPLPSFYAAIDEAYEIAMATA